MTSSAGRSPIPVKNIYYMLVYAWNHPHEKEFINVIGEDEKDLLHLLGKVLIIKVKALIKRGFYKEYAEKQEVSSIIRGKILFKESIATLSYKKGKLHLLEENMTYDILHNQLIKTILYHLANSDGLEQELRDEISAALTYFHGISLIQVTSRLFNEVKMHRNNQHYRFILHICQFITEQVLLHEEKSDKQFQDVSREHQQMARLFESFVKNFYRTELPGSVARSETLYWPAEGKDVDLLPNMRTDISLEYSGEKTIIDTKFYKDTFAQFWNKATVHSPHLYQMFAYLKNDEYVRGKKARGLLLYPKNGQNADLQYKMHGFSLRICTLDLTQPWREIHESLLELAGNGVCSELRLRKAEIN